MVQWTQQHSTTVNNWKIAFTPLSRPVFIQPWLVESMRLCCNMTMLLRHWSTAAALIKTKIRELPSGIEFLPNSFNICRPWSWAAVRRLSSHPLYVSHPSPRRQDIRFSGSRLGKRVSSRVFWIQIGWVVPSSWNWTNGTKVGESNKKWWNIHWRMMVV